MRKLFKLFHISLLGFVASSLPCRAETVTLTPSADTTLHEKFPGHNIGAHFDMAAGGVGSGERTRALLKFDLAGKVPDPAAIASVSLTLQLTRQPSSGGPAANFELRRVLRPWTEGAKKSTSGEPASAGETTWAHRSHPDGAWTAAGGGLGDDFASQPSATVEVGGRGAYTFASTPSLIADIRAWIENPASNFGWALVCREEAVRETARRFASREDPANAPSLAIALGTEPASLRIARVAVDGVNLTLEWTGGAGPLFQVQRRASLLNAPWENLGTLISDRSIRIPVSGSLGFFRIVEAAGNPPSGPSEPPPPPPPVEPPPATETVTYEVVFQSDWSQASHPQDFPLGAHWSPLIGGTHDAQTSFWEEGAVATRGIEDVAELGSIVALRSEINAAIEQKRAFNVFTRSGSIPATGTVSTTFAVHRDYPLVTLVTMIAPSPDWFTGVHGLKLHENGQWLDKKVVVLNLYDAGTDSGASYNSLDSDTQPRERIRQITGFPARVNGNLVPFGTFTFTRQP